jgi:hypothetical protein
VPTNGQYKPAWPKGTPQRLTKAFAKHFFDLLSTSEKSLFGFLQDHPEFPNHSTLGNWRNRHPWFNEAWNQARKDQAEFFVQRSIDFASECTPENAHCQRLKADIYWRVAAKFFPNVYGDKPAQQSTTHVSIGVVLPQERLDELRAKLDSTRSAFIQNGQSQHETKQLTLNKP